MPKSTRLPAILAAGTFTLGLAGCQQDTDFPVRVEPAAMPEPAVQAPTVSPESVPEAAMEKSTGRREFDEWRAAILADTRTREAVEVECEKAAKLAEEKTLVPDPTGITDEELDALDPMQCRVLRDIRLAERSARHPGAFPAR